MAKETKYSLINLKKDFPTEDACLEFIFETLHSYECSCGGTYKRVKGRKQYQCSKCRFQIAPTAGTIFHKSETPLSLWFHALWVFSNAKSGISAKELERQLGVTYKTAWRMLNLIRSATGRYNGTYKLHGLVEMDGAYFGGHARGRDPLANKAAAMGAVERGGDIVARVVPDMSAKTHKEFLETNVESEGTVLMTDATNKIGGGYERWMVNHKKHEYVKGNAHINTIEAFWAHVKRSIVGTHKNVSKQHLQSYLDAFAFHWSNSHNDKERFSVLLGTVLLGEGS